MSTIIKQSYGDFKEDCFPRPSGGCRCNIKATDGHVTVRQFDSEDECKIPNNGLFLYLNRFLYQQFA